MQGKDLVERLPLPAGVVVPFSPLMLELARRCAGLLIRALVSRIGLVVVVVCKLLVWRGELRAPVPRDIAEEEVLRLWQGE